MGGGGNIGEEADLKWVGGGVVAKGKRTRV